MKWFQALVGLLLAFTVVQFVSSQTCSNLDADVIIIGAGMSGVSSAKRLQENGINKILILEASSRVGGRMRSAAFAGVTVNLGAGWISGLDPMAPELHPVYEMAQTCGGEPLRGSIFDGESVSFYDSQGGTNFTGEKALRYDDYYAAFDGASVIAANLTENGQCAGASYRYALNSSGWVPTTPEDNWIDWSNFDLSEGELPVTGSACFAVIDDTFTDFTSPDTAYGSSYTVTDAEGYDKLPKCLIEKVLEDEQARLQFDSKVTEIDWSNENCVCITANMIRYCARYAISTVSVGVLRSNAIRFVPELPESKNEVLQKFTMARYTHLLVEFSEVFWDDTDTINHIHEDRGYFAQFFNLHRAFPENPKALKVFISGDLTERVLGQSEADTAAEIEQIMTNIYPGRNVNLTNILIPDWWLNPLFLGTWGHRNVNITLEDPPKLASPINNLYFSGEATSTRFWGYVHGAYYTGIDTADKIIQIENKATTVQISSLVLGLCTLCAALYSMQ